MTSTAETPGSDAFLASLAGFVHEVESAGLQVAAAQVRELRVLAAAGRLAETQSGTSPGRVREHDMILRSIAAELGGVMRVADRTVQRRISEARVIVEDFPGALAAWESGAITRGHVMVIVETGSVVPPELRAEFETAAIARCERDTPNRVRAELEILAQRMHPRSFTERHAEAAAGRCVRVLPGRDGMSDLVATLPTAIVEGVHVRLTQMARAIIDTRAERADAASGDRPAGAVDGAGADAEIDDHDRHEAITTDTRSTDQVRADVFADLLLAGTPALDDTRDTTAGPLGAIRARVQVVVPALALAGADEPCDLVGRSPIDPTTARLLAGSTPTWERLVTDPVTGTVLALDSYRVPSAMRRYLQARDQHCRFPGCRTAAIRCEVDHTHDHALGGATETTNLAHLCQRHHSMKQFSAWRVRQLSGGVLEWTSPLGRTYREDAPTPAVAFAPAAPPRGTDTGTAPF
ncbi:HNH endonuclease [Microbacterium marinum]|uniref:HNH endonuclease signature motif containing protein n=1 Tax=Microbacterium marinum TaxID=421115 RepID=UPI0038501839